MKPSREPTRPPFGRGDRDDRTRRLPRRHHGRPAEETAPATPSPTDRAHRLVERSFAVERVGCGDDYGGHDVTAEGTLDGSNGCFAAELVAGEDELYVEVESVEDRGDEEGCVTCVVEIDYVVRFTFEGGGPSSVRVRQRGVSTGSASASRSESAPADGNGSVSESEFGSGESTPTDG